MKNTEVNLIELTLEHMKHEDFRKMASLILEQEVRKVVKQSVSLGKELEDVACDVAHKLQSKMSPVEAQNFSAALYQMTGVDARTSKMVSVVPARTLDDVQKLYELHCSLDSSRRFTKKTSKHNFA